MGHIDGSVVPISAALALCTYLSQNSLPAIPQQHHYRAASVPPRGSINRSQQICPRRYRPVACTVAPATCRERETLTPGQDIPSIYHEAPFISYYQRWAGCNATCRPCCLSQCHTGFDQCGMYSIAYPTLKLSNTPLVAYTG